jgi:hypothetical protein
MPRPVVRPAGQELTANPGCTWLESRRVAPSISVCTGGGLGANAHPSCDQRRAAPITARVSRGGQRRRPGGVAARRSARTGRRPARAARRPDGAVRKRRLRAQRGAPGWLRTRPRAGLAPGRRSRVGSTNSARTSATWKYATGRDPSVTITTVPGSTRRWPALATTSHAAVAAERQALRSAARITNDASPSAAVAGGTYAVAA